MKQNKEPVAELGSDYLKEVKNDLAYPCSTRKIPLWLVFLDNIPTLVLFTLGFAIIYHITIIGAVIFSFYALFSIVWFWAKICPFCHHYNTLACPCGYGAVSSKLFKKRNDKPFKKVFRQNIGIVFPNWFIPFAIAIFLLVTRYSGEILILTIAFSLTGFVIIPLISKLVACKNCEIREDCPWMTADKEK
jgi:hypothetical protein